jgi:formate-dependent nitrite reductase membrane component NrfD
MTDQRRPSAITPDDVAASLARGDGGFGRDQTNYFEHPVLQKSHWRWEIAWYFFLGGMGAGSALLAELADHGDDPNDAALVRTGRYAAMAAAAASGLLLTKDLGRPERFLNMLRIVKLKSPMSVGAWSLVIFSATSGLAFLDQARRDGWFGLHIARFFPRRLRDVAQILSAGLMASYTGVLISATAIPVWFTGRRHIPAIFVCSAISTACALNSALLALHGEHASTIAKLERLEAVAAGTEALLLFDFERRAGDLGDALFTGATGKSLKTRTLALGIAVPLLLNLPSIFSKRPHGGTLSGLRTLVAAGLTLAGGFALRESMLAAGRTSADDPSAYLRPH